MRIAWLTDIHLNFVTEEVRDQFAQALAKERPDVVLVSGDIAEAPTLHETLRSLKLSGTGDLLYVLGNHDFYHGRIDDVRDGCRRAATGTYLHGIDPVRLTESTCVVGVDGWADGRLGRPHDSELIFTDWAVIDDFKEVDAVFDVDARLRMVQALGDESADCLKRALETAAAARFQTIFVVTHIPPFSRAIPPEKAEVAELWIPWLVCKATGDVLLEFAGHHPDVQIEVFAGHVHIEYEVRPLPNLVCRVGNATYRAPKIQRVWQLE